jgi:cardiolipin synthase
VVITWDWSPTVAVITLLVDLVIRVTALFIVPRNRKPTSGMAWLLAIFFLPVPGIIIFLIIGSIRLPRARVAKQDAINKIIAGVADRSELEDLEHHLSIEEDFSQNPWLQDIARLGRNLGAQPMLSGNAASISRDYEGSIADMAAEIRAAQSFVHIEFYILSYDAVTADFFAAISEATDRGVKVRVLLDHIAAVRSVGNRKTVRMLTQVGAQWSYMLPVRPWRGEYQRPDLRNHRKLLVVDGQVGFMGSQNLIDSTYNKKSNLRRGLHWKDIMVRLEGPVVIGLNAVFVSDWYLETDELISDESAISPIERREENLHCQVLPSGPGFSDENNLQVFVSLMYMARKRVSITSPYFVPEPSIMNALRAATSRGVEVELFVSEIGDQPMVYHAQRSFYEELLKAGVRIFMFTPPYILHSKHFTIDDAVAVIGSSNMDERSFSLNMEISMLFYSESFVRELDEVIAYYHENSRELTAEEWSRQPLRSQLLDNLSRLTSALQ